jgi:hypothetical protein
VDLRQLVKVMGYIGECPIGESLIGEIRVSLQFNQKTGLKEKKLVTYM